MASNSRTWIKSTLSWGSIELCWAGPVGYPAFALLAPHLMVDQGGDAPVLLLPLPALLGEVVLLAPPPRPTLLQELGHPGHSISK